MGLIAASDVASRPQGVIRRWTLAEIVTAVAEHDFRVSVLEEVPLQPRDRLPGMFSLLAFRE